MSAAYSSWRIALSKPTKRMRMLSACAMTPCAGQSRVIENVRRAAEVPGEVLTIYQARLRVEAEVREKLGKRVEMGGYHAVARVRALICDAALCREVERVSPPVSRELHNAHRELDRRELNLAMAMRDAINASRPSGATSWIRARRRHRARRRAVRRKYWGPTPHGESRLLTGGRTNII